MCWIRESWNHYYSAYSFIWPQRLDATKYVIYILVCFHFDSVLSTINRIPMIRNAVWTLSNLCRGKDPPADFSKVSRGLPLLARLLFHTDNDVLSDTCWAISYLSDGPNDKIQAVIDAGVCRRLVELLMYVCGRTRIGVYARGVRIRIMQAFCLYIPGTPHRI